MKLLLLLLLANGSASPVAQKASYASANQAYLQGNFAKAAEEYEALVESGIVHEELYYNLGNAYYRQNKLGHAVYNYERALRVDPDFPDAYYNLGVAREAIAAKVVDKLRGAETDPMWVRAVTILTTAELVVGFLILNFVFFALLIWLRFLSNGFARTAVLVANGFIAFALTVSILMLVGRAYYTERVPMGIIVADKVWMREAPDENVAGRAEVHPGLRVRILAREPAWLRVRLANGVEGWIPRPSVGEL
jgi:tetratricopeptide (TPR) repeat protein